MPCNNNVCEFKSLIITLSVTAAEGSFLSFSENCEKSLPCSWLNPLQSKNQIYSVYIIYKISKLF